MGHQFGLKSLSELGLVDAPAEAAFDNLTDLAQRMLDVPVALVSVVQPALDRQFFKSAVGLPEPWASLRQTPLSHSFCKHVRATGQPLIVQDARQDPRVAENLAVRDLGVIAYLGVPLLDPLGQPIGAFCVIDTVPRDWTADEVDRVARFGAVASEQVKLKAALAAMQDAHDTAVAAASSRSTFLAYMSHELRTPLHGMLGLADMLQRDLPPGDARDMAGLLHTCGNGLLRQLNDILDLARIDAGRLALDPVPFRPDALLRRLVDLHGATAAAKNVGIELDIGPDCAATLIGDDHRIGQVVGNILSNAVKFTDAGQVRIAARVTWPDDGQALLHLTVADTGPGMCPDLGARLFEPFLQGDPSVGRTHGGSGLGLTIVKSILDAMGGTIDVESAPGQGTTVRAVLPLRVAAPTTDAEATVATAADGQPDDAVILPCGVARPVSALPPDGGTQAGTPKGTQTGPTTPPVPTGCTGTTGPALIDAAGLHILVADDDAISRLILEKALRRAGFAVSLAHDGSSALAALARTRFDALVFDFRMPGLSGPELLARLHGSDWTGPNRATPAIAVSAEGDTALQRMAAKAGFAAAFCKPVRGDSIADAVRRLSTGVGTW